MLQRAAFTGLALARRRPPLPLPQGVRQTSGGQKAGGEHYWSEDWKRAGLGATKPESPSSMSQLLFVQTGFGCDQHGDRARDGATKAAVRACRNAIEFNSIPCIQDIVPGGRPNMKIHVTLGVPAALHVDREKVAATFPYGQILDITVVPGGLEFESGRVVEALGDEEDSAIIVCAAVKIGM